MNLRKVLVVGLLVLGYPNVAMAQHQGSIEDQIACTPDVYRLCASQIPDEDAITACLERHKPSLSQACRQVFSRPPEPANPDESDD